MLKNKILWTEVIKINQNTVELYLIRQYKIQIETNKVKKNPTI